jgi:hypothetical protein
VHDHSRRFVHQEQPFVLIQDLQRDRFWPRGFARNLRQDNGYPLSSHQPIARLAPLVFVDPDAAGSDHPAEMGPRVLGEVVDEEQVQPPTLLGRFHHEFHRLRGRYLR